MTPEFAYFWKVNAAFVLLYAFYRLFFYRDTFFKLRRTILLATIGVSLFYPLMDIQEWIRGQEPMAGVIHMYATILPETAVTASHDVPQTEGLNPLFLLMYCLYWGGVVALSVRFLVQISCIWHLACSTAVRRIKGVRVHVLNRPAGPFSFFRLIFLHPESHSEKETDEILTHELTHVNRWHSIDVVLYELACILFWINPFIWLLKREVRHNLEYLADDSVIESGYDTKSYQYHLLGLAHTNRSATALSNSFNMMHLKNRISMMNKRRSHGIGRAKYLFFIPITASLLVLSNIDAVARLTDRITENPLTEALLPEAAPPTEKPVGRVQEEEKAEDQVFTVVEVMPEFPGGQNALLKYLAAEIKYPEAAKKKGIEGRVSCAFTVRKDGAISDVGIIRGVDPALDAEALRVIRSMPAWEPGRQRGKAVNVRYTVPVTFRLQKKETVSRQQPPKTNTSGRIFTIVQKMPEFPGGQQSLQQYMAKNIRYPVKAQELGIQGRVSCSFVIDTDGSLKDIKVIRGVDPLLDAEAVRVIEKMPNWKPGIQNSRAVAVQYTVPVTFRLQ